MSPPAILCSRDTKKGTKKGTKKYEMLPPAAVAQIVAQNNYFAVIILLSLPSHSRYLVITHAPTSPVKPNTALSLADTIACGANRVINDDWVLPVETAIQHDLQTTHPTTAEKVDCLQLSNRRTLNQQQQSSLTHPKSPQQQLHFSFQAPSGEQQALPPIHTSLTMSEHPSTKPKSKENVLPTQPS